MKKPWSAIVRGRCFPALGLVLTVEILMVWFQSN